MTTAPPELPPYERSSEPAQPDLRQPVWLLLLRVGFAIALVFVIGVALLQAVRAGYRFETPMLFVAGVVVVITAVLLTSTVAWRHGVRDLKYALALPAGSVRALIALMLITIFAMFVAYFFERLGVRPNPAEADYAKQVTVLIGTLLTAVTSFYFAERAATATVDATVSPASPSPIIYRVNPTTLHRESLGRVTVVGTGLRGATTVSLRRGPIRVTADDLKFADEGLYAFFPRTSFLLDPGDWDVVVDFPGGVTATLDEAITLI